MSESGSQNQNKIGFDLQLVLVYRKNTGEVLEQRRYPMDRSLALLREAFSKTGDFDKAIESIAKLLAFEDLSR